MSKEIKFKELEPGQSFYYEGFEFIKVEPKMINTSPGIIDAFNILGFELANARVNDHNIYTYFDKDSKVKPLTKEP